MRDAWWMVTLAVVACAAGIPNMIQAAEPATSTADLVTGTKPEEARRQKTAQEQRREKVAELVADARKLYEATQFREAADLLRQATVIDPKYEDAQLLLRIVMTKIVEREIPRGVEPPVRIPGDSDLPVGVPSPIGMITVTSSTGLKSPETAADRAARDRLAEHLKEITSDQQGLEKVLNFLRDNMGANIFVDWATLNRAQIERTTPVSVSLKDISFSNALSTILALVSPPNRPLAFTIDDGIITISTKEELASPKYQSVFVYDVRGLLFPPAAQNGAAQTAPAATAPEDPRRKEAIDSLIKEIETIVAPDTWRSNGGTIGTIRELNGQLSINQTRDNHVAIYTLLQRLAATRGVQIAMESRIYFVADNVLNDFRVEWEPQGPLTDALGSRVRAAVLDNEQLVMMLTLRRDRGTLITTSIPRRTLGEGLEEKITSTPAQRYITGYVAKNAGDVIQYEPEYGATGPAISLSLVPSIRQDRRYVQMKLAVNVQRLTRLDHAPAPNTPAEKGMQVDKPILSTASAEFDKTVQDGGTILLDAGLIPADALQLKVADGLLSGARPQGDVRILILLRPSIVIHRELENDLFGVGYDRPAGLTPATNPQPSTQK